MEPVQILIVEDEIIVAEDIRTKLTGLGYTVVAIASSGEEAIEFAADMRPDLVLMDIKLAGKLDGVEAAGQIWNRFYIPVVYLTVYADDDTLQRAKVTEPFGYILKPFGMDTLHSTIEMALYKHEIERSLKESERRYRTVSELTSDFVYFLRVEPGNKLILEWATEAFVRITGFRVEEIVSWSQYIYPDDLLSVLERTHSLLAGQPNVCEYRIVTRNGLTRWLRDYSRPILNKPQERITHIMGAAQDITERKEMEESLSHYARRLQALHGFDRDILAARLPEAIAQAALDDIRDLIPCRQACVILFDSESNQAKIVAAQSDQEAGLKKGMVFPLNVFQEDMITRSGQLRLVRDIMTVVSPSPFEQILLGEGLAAYINIPLIIQDDLIGLLSLAAESAAVFTADNLDIAEEVATSVAIAIQHGRLYEKSQQEADTKAILLQEINHRVKNNLAAIIGLLYLERRQVREEDQVIIANLISRIQGLATVHELLSACEWSPLPLSEMAGQVIRAALSTTPLNKHIAIEVPSSPVRVSPKQANVLALIINELTINTVKYALLERWVGHIRVNIGCKDDQVSFEFRDDGPGYPEEVLHQDSYHVGLYLIQTIVRRDLDGELTLYNDNGAVTRIQFKLIDS